MNNVPKLMIYVLFLFISLTLYGHSLHNSLVIDDDILLADNLYIRDLRFIPKLFTTDAFRFKSGSDQYAGGYYRPLQTLSYACEYVFWKLNPFGYHLSNIFIHSLVSFLVFLLIVLLFKDSLLAFLSGCLFCVHPIQVSMAAFISARGHLFEAVFVLLSLITFIHYRSNGKKKNYIQSLLFLVLALLSWEGALLLPLFIVSCALILSMPRKKIILCLFPYFLICIIYWLLRIRFFPSAHLGLANLFSFHSLFEFMRLLLSYINQLIFPLGLRMMLWGPGGLPGFLLCVLSCIFLVCFVLSLTVLRDRVVVFAALFYVIGLSMVLALADTMKYFGTILSEHYVYLSSIGFCVFIAWLIIRLRSLFPKTALTVFAFLLFVYCSLTIINTTNYKDSETFHVHLLAVDNDNVLGRINLGNIYYEKEMYAQAEKQVEFISTTEPDAWKALFLLGNIRTQQENLGEAEEFYKKALALNPHAAGEVANNLGLIYKMQGRYDKALEVFRKAAKSNPESLIILNNLIALLFEKELYPEAQSFVAKALELGSGDVTTLVNTGAILIKMGRGKDAMVILEEALRLDPASVAAMNSLGGLYASMGNFDKALSLWERGLQLDPDHRQIRKNIAYMKKARGH